VTVPLHRDVAALATRGTSNGNESGNSRDRQRRKAWLVETYRANFDVMDVREMMRADPPILAAGEGSEDERMRPGMLPVAVGDGTPACRCYRCGVLLTVETLTVDRIIPGALGGRYVRNNIRPACAPCNSITGGGVRSKKGKK